MKVVVDTNVLIGASLSAGGANRHVIRMCLNGLLLPQLSNALFSEYEDVYCRPELLKHSLINAERRQLLLEAFLSCCNWNHLYFTWRPNLRDEGDNHLVELAVASGAVFLVTNNVKDFKQQQLRFSSFEVISPADFLRRMS